MTVEDDQQFTKNVDSLMKIAMETEDSCNNGIYSYLLPRSIVNRIVASNSDNVLINKESKEFFVHASTLFISYLTSAALECNGTKKTLSPESVLAGLKLCGFDEIHADLFSKYQEHSKLKVNKRIKSTNDEPSHPDEL